MKFIAHHGNTKKWNKSGEYANIMEDLGSHWIVI